MDSPLLLEMLAAEHQRELVDEAARDRIAVAMVGHRGPQWRVFATVLRHLAAALVTPSGSEEHCSEIAIVGRV